MSRRTALAVLATATVVFAALAVRANRSPSGAARASAPGAPVLSLQRTPQLLVRLAGDVRLATALDSTLADPALGTSAAACLLVRDASGRIVYSRQPDRALIPASNLKLVTAFAMLARLGASPPYRTEVVAGGVASGVVAGDLWLVGGGDPLLATADYAAQAGYDNQPRLATSLESLADRVVAAGVREVQGRVLGDEGRYDTERYNPVWKQSYITAAEVGPASALTVNSGFTEWKPAARAAAAPATHAASVFAGLLQARGVAIGGTGEGGAPQNARRVASIESSSMRDVLAEMVQHSDNLAAELMVKELGKRFGAGGTTAAGLAVIRDTLKGAGLQEGALTANDGSGLDRGDRATCGLLVALLQRAGDKGPLVETLPVAGRDGTLAKRFLTSPAAGRLRAKTGALEGVMGLSGWVDAEQSARLVFSLLVNGLPREAVGRMLEERLGTALARYPQAPSADAIAP